MVNSIASLLPQLSIRSKLGLTSPSRSLTTSPSSTTITTPTTEDKSWARCWQERTSAKDDPSQGPSVVREPGEGDNWGRWKRKWVPRSLSLPFSREDTTTIDDAPIVDEDAIDDVPVDDACKSGDEHNIALDDLDEKGTFHHSRIAPSSSPPSSPPPELTSGTNSSNGSDMDDGEDHLPPRHARTEGRMRTHLAPHLDLAYPSISQQQSSSNMNIFCENTTRHGETRARRHSTPYPSPPPSSPSGESYLSGPPQASPNRSRGRFSFSILPSPKRSASTSDPTIDGRITTDHGDAKSDEENNEGEGHSHDLYSAPSVDTDQVIHLSTSIPPIHASTDGVLLVSPPSGSGFGSGPGTPSPPSSPTPKSSWIRTLTHITLPRRVTSSGPAPPNTAALLHPVPSISDPSFILSTPSPPEIAEAKRTALIAKSVYCPRNRNLRKWKCLGHCSPVIAPKVLRIFDVGSTAARAAMYAMDGRIYIAFRGSVRLTNWANNLYTAKVVTQIPGAPPAVRVHAGFWRSWRSIRPQILVALDRALSTRPHNTPIILCGHSLGGALAQLCAADLKATLGDLPDMRVWTYGQPRVGNRAWAEHYATLHIPTARIVHGSDLFPHLGPKKMGWRHAGDEWWVRKAGTVIIHSHGPPGIECKDGSNSVTGALSITNHLTIWATRYNEVCFKMG